MGENTQTTGEERLVSVLGFAKLVGCDEKTIRQYIKPGGKLSGHVEDDEKGRRKLRRAEGLAAWASFGGGSRKAIMGGNAAPAPAPAPPSTTPPEMPGKAPAGLNAGRSGTRTGKAGEEPPDIVESKAWQAYFAAEKARTEYEQMIGDLVRKSDVYAALFSKAADLRTNLLALPDRLVDAVMAAGSRHEGRAAIYDAIEAVLLKFTTDDVLDDDAEKKPAD